MELSDETSRSESSVSLGGGGGSLSGTAVKAGDFLEKNTSCHLGAGRRPDEAGMPLPRALSFGRWVNNTLERAGDHWGKDGYRARDVGMRERILSHTALIGEMVPAFILGV